MIIEIPNLDGNIVRLPVEQIQFFWQKCERFSSRFVTQIVYNTEDVPTVEADGMPANLVLPLTSIESRIVGRAVVETPTPLDEITTSIWTASAHRIRCLHLHRVATCEDNRVIAP